MFFKSLNSETLKFEFFLSLRVDNLIEGHDYNFRVKAVNKEGESQPLKGDYPVTAKDPFGKPGQPGQPQATGESFLMTGIYCMYFENENA